jgi:hypothetical protein
VSVHVRSCLNVSAAVNGMIQIIIVPFMDLTEIGWEGVDWIDLAQNRDPWRVAVNTVMNLRVT